MRWQTLSQCSGNKDSADSIDCDKTSVKDKFQVHFRAPVTPPPPGFHVHISAPAFSDLNYTTVVPRLRDRALLTSLSLFINYLKSVFLSLFDKGPTFALHFLLGA